LRIPIRSLLIRTLGSSGYSIHSAWLGGARLERASCSTALVQAPPKLLGHELDLLHRRPPRPSLAARWSIGFSAPWSPGCGSSCPAIA